MEKSLTVKISPETDWDEDDWRALARKLAPFIAEELGLKREDG